MFETPSRDQAHVDIELHEAHGTRRVRVHAGDLIGRVPSAAVLVDDPQVSEAHALVTMRRGRFVLLCLRRRVEVDGQPARDVELRTGLDVGLSATTRMRVLDVHIPPDVLGVESEGIGQRVLGPVASFSGGVQPVFWGRFELSADAHVWSLGGRWRVRLRGENARELRAGDTIELDGASFRFVALDTRTAPPPSSQSGDGSFVPLRIITHYDGVEIHRDDHPLLILNGLGARVIAELAAFDAPVPWTLVAREVWALKEVEDLQLLRHRWDMTLNRLRKKLDAAEVRSSLVRSDRMGCVQLVLQPDDTLEDRA